MRNAILTAGVLAGCLGASARGQLAMDWSTIDGGGGESAGPTLELKGTIGQWDSGPTLGGATIDVTGGFWPGFVECPADFNCDGFVDFFDYDAFVEAYEGGALPACKTSADINGDGFIDFFDYDDFVALYEQGC